MLVSVYGSKEMFVKEYRQLLAERLTSSNTKDVSEMSCLFAEICAYIYRKTVGFFISFPLLVRYLVS